MLNPRPTYEEFRQEIKAHILTHSRLKKGFIKRPVICEECKIESLKIQAHHPDYSKPYIINWLCAKCHGKYRRDKIA